MSSIKKLSTSFRQKCESIATEQRYRLNLKAYDPLPAKTLATALGATIISPELMPGINKDAVSALIESKSWSAAIIQLQPLNILYNPSHAPARHESNIMHELAHFLLKHPLQELNIKTGSFTASSSDEEEATFLGGCLQIPRRGLLWAVQGKMSCKKIAHHFLASEEMVVYRSNVTGVKF